MIVNFSWILPGQLGGAGQPGGWGYTSMSWQDQLDEDLGWLARQGVRALVTLTEEPLTEALLDRHGISYLHLPIEDMQAPKLSEVSVFVSYVDRALEEERPVVVHCRAGLGRTGTMLACYLVHREKEPVQALAEVRALRPGSVETWAQERVVYEYAASLKIPASWRHQMSWN